MRLLSLILLPTLAMPTIAQAQTMPSMGTGSGGGMPSMGGSGGGMPSMGGWTRFGKSISKTGLTPGETATLILPAAIDGFKIKLVKSNACGVAKFPFGIGKKLTEVGSGTPAQIGSLPSFALPTYDFMMPTGTDGNGVKWVNPGGLGVNLVDPVCAPGGPIVPLNQSAKTAKALYIGGHAPGSPVMIRFKVENSVKRVVNSCGQVTFGLKHDASNLTFDRLEINGMPSGTIPSMGPLIPADEPPLCLKPDGATTGVSYVPFNG